MQTERQLESQEMDLSKEQDTDDLEQPKKTLLGRWRIAILCILIAVSGGGYYAYTQMIAPASNQGTRKRDRTVAIKRTDLPIIVTANGTIQPEKSINVSPKSSGRLKSLLVKESENVRTGQILAYMDESNTLGQITQADGNLAAAHIRVLFEKWLRHIY